MCYMFNCYSIKFLSSGTVSTNVQTCSTRVRTSLESGLKSIYCWTWTWDKSVTKSTFNFYWAHFAVLFRPYDIWPTHIVHTTKDLRYLLTVELTHGLACSCSSVNKGRHSRAIKLYWFLCYWYILQLRTWTWSWWICTCVILSDLDLKLVDLHLTWLLLDLIQVCQYVADDFSWNVTVWILIAKKCYKI